MRKKSFTINFHLINSIRGAGSAALKKCLPSSIIAGEHNLNETDLHPKRNYFCAHEPFVDPIRKQAAAFPPEQSFFTFSSALVHLWHVILLPISFFLAETFLFH
jgi:hypothetical protein